MFTVDVVLKLLVCPNKSKFLQDFFNVVDIVSVVPFYVELIFPSLGQSDAFIVVRIMRLARISRIVNMSRYSESVRVFSMVRHSVCSPCRQSSMLVVPSDCVQQLTAPDVPRIPAADRHDHIFDGRILRGVYAGWLQEPSLDCARWRLLPAGERFHADWALASVPVL